MNLRLLAAGLCVAVVGSVPAFAQFTPIATPVASYTGSTTVLSIPGANFSTTSTLADANETLTFSNPVDVRTVPSGGWGTWNSPPATESATPKVLYNSGLSLTIGLSSPKTIFGFEVETNNSGTYSVTATFYNGATVLGTITQSIVSTSGALLAAASSGTPITSVTITAAAGSGGFAIAQLRYASPAAPPTVTSVPVLGLPAMGALAILLLACGSLLARRQKLNCE